VDAVRSETDLIVQLSTGGSVHDPLETRLTVLDAEPDSCSLTCGTTNFGDDVFLNPWGFMSDLYVQAQEREVVPEFELFDLGHVHALRRLIDTHGLPFGGKVHVDFVTGVPGGMPATTAALMAGVAMLPAEVTSWSATGIGAGAPADHGCGPVGRWSPARGYGGQRGVRPADRSSSTTTSWWFGLLSWPRSCSARRSAPRRPVSCSGSRTAALADPAGWTCSRSARRSSPRAPETFSAITVMAGMIRTDGDISPTRANFASSSVMAESSVVRGAGRRLGLRECLEHNHWLWLTCALLLNSRPSSTRRPPGPWQDSSCSSPRWPCSPAGSG
jgi:hypothetical protein